LLVAIVLSVLVHLSVLGVLHDIRPSIASTRSAIAMSMREPPPPKEEPKVTPIAVVPPRPKPKLVPKDKPQDVAPKIEAKQGAAEEKAPADEPARAPTPGPEEEVKGTGPAAGNGPMLGEGVNTTEGQPVRAASRENTSPNGQGVPGAKVKSDLKNYHVGVEKAVRALQHYPPAARRFGLEGRAVIAVQIDRAGKIVGKPRMVESTKHDILDEEAMRMIEAAAPFPPLPITYTESVAGFLIPIKFHLTD
jgi:protein TonB